MTALSQTDWDRTHCPDYPEQFADDQLDQVGCFECGSAQIVALPGEKRWEVHCPNCGAVGPAAVSPNFNWFPDGKGGFDPEFIDREPGL